MEKELTLGEFRDEADRKVGNRKKCPKCGSEKMTISSDCKSVKVECGKCGWEYE